MRQSSQAPQLLKQREMPPKIWTWIMIKLKAHSPPPATPLNINIITLNVFFEDGCLGWGRLGHSEAAEAITYLTCTRQVLWNVTPGAGCLSFMEQLANPNCFKLALRKRDLRINKLQLSYIQMCIIIMKTIWWLFRSDNKEVDLSL